MEVRVMGSAKRLIAGMQVSVRVRANYPSWFLCVPKTASCRVGRR